MSSLIPNPNIFLPKTVPIIQPKYFIPMWLYKWLTIVPFIGFFGIDHWAIDSKFTGIMKLFVNLFTFGSWYAYDIVQAWNGIRIDKKTVQSEGLDVPFFGGFNIGKGKFDSEPLFNMSNNTQLWLLVLFIGLFGFIFYITSFFLTSQSGFLVNSISNVSFYTIIALVSYTLFFFIFSKIRKPSVFNMSTSRSGTKQSLYSQFGVVNPLTTKQTKSRVSSVLGSFTPGLTLPKMSGGGDFKELSKTLESMESIMPSEDHKYFLLLLTLLPISGFAAYGIIKNKKNSNKDEVS